jgi:hypothetical protein
VRDIFHRLWMGLRVFRGDGSGLSGDAGAVCLVHMVRNSLSYVGGKRKAVAAV